MHLRRLKRWRVALAVAFLALTSLLFLDYRELGAVALADTVLYLQFVPSLLRSLDALTLGTAGFLVVLALTLFVGRAYCSTVCPLGTVQDAASRLAGPLAGRGHRKHAFRAPNTRTRYAVPGLTALLFLAGSGLALNLLDPFSGFGRMLANLVRPLLLAANNLAAPVAESLGSHAVYRVAWPAMAPASMLVAAATLLVVGWVAARRGRLYCNTICPVGALLGLVSRFAVFRVRMDRSACTGCGRCERVCKSECIDFRQASVDASRCVMCCNCLAACPEDALRLLPRRAFSPGGGEESPDRRRFLVWLAVGGLPLAAGAAKAALPEGFVPDRPTTVPEQRTGPSSPPGSGSIERFTSRCTACHLCVAVCPSGVLVPSLLAYGPSGLMQPRLDYRASYCDYECTACTRVCPSGAIEELAVERKRRVQVGKARFIKENCVVHTDKTNCGACSEHCPTKAVHMVPYSDAPGRGLVIPEVDAAICVGCGACEHACPTRPYRAICVDGNPVHKVARKPEVKELERPAGMEEDFPF